MDLYLDTSSLVKIYLDEEDSGEMRRLMSEGHRVATSIVTYAEARSALAKARRDDRLSSTELDAARQHLDESWAGYVIVGVRDELVREAGELAERYRLRGCDSVHLASYALVVRYNARADVQFSTYDKKLDRAARALASRLAGKRPPWSQNGHGQRTGDNETGRRV